MEHQDIYYICLSNSVCIEEIYHKEILGRDKKVCFCRLWIGGADPGMLELSDH